ncbi:MAG: PAS domain S-box protein, partial [Sedimentisphaerales bacterium]|nr:PAS domain S-box protein [Sedimentisphaerales bacterium]
KIKQLKTGAAVFCYILIMWGLYIIRLHSFLLFHTTVEVFSVCVAFSIFMIVWNSRFFIRNDCLLFIGIAYLFVGVLDFIHTLAYKGMGVFPEYGTNLATQLWISARYMEGLSLLIAPWFLKHRLKVRIALPVYLLTTCLLLLTIFYWGVFPVCFVEQRGLTVFKDASEFVIIAILAASLILFLKERSKFDAKVTRWVSWSIGLTMISELMFTMYTGPYESANMFGHFLKLVSFYFIYKALVETGLKEPYNLLFRELKKSEQNLQKARDGLEVEVKQRTAELSQSEERFRLMAETIPDVFWMSTPGIEKMIYVSPVYEKIWGRTCESLYKYPKAFIEAVHPEDIENVKATLSDHAKGYWDIEYRIVQPDGSICWIRDRGFPIRDEHNNTRMMTGIATDVTKRKQMEISVKELARTMDAFFEHTITPIVFLERNFNFIRVNQAYARACQRKVSEFIGHNLFEFYPHKENQKIFEQVVKTKTPYQASEKAFNFQDHPEWGITYWDWTLVPILDSSGEVEFLVFSLEDVTDHKKSQDTIVSKQEQLRRLSSELLMVEEQERRKLAIDLHDSVGQILAFLKIELGNMLRSEMPSESVRTLKQILEHVKEAIKQTRTLTFEISPPELYTIGLESAIEELPRRFTEERNLQCRFETTNEPKVLNEQVKILLYRSVRELLINVLKHAKATMVNVTVGNVNDDIEITVEDDGKGFEPSEFNKSQGAKSTGFGLFSISERMTNIGGTLDIQSSYDNGTRITLRAPLETKVQKKEY